MTLHNPLIIDRKKLFDLLRKGISVIIQFSENVYTEEILSEINTLCSISDDNLLIRFYSHEKSQFDCRKLKKLTDVKFLSLDNLISIENISIIQDFTCLKRFSIDVENFSDTDILNFKNLKKVRELFLTIHKGNNYDLKHLAENKNLEDFTLKGHLNDIECVGQIISLKTLSIWHLKRNHSLNFINNLPELKELSLFLGGRYHLHELKKCNIEVLKINKVRGFYDLSNLSNFRNLKMLVLTDLTQIKKLEFPESFSSFEEIAIFNCKNLNEMGGIENLESVKRITIDRVNVSFEEFIKNKFPKTLEILAFYTDKVRQDNEIYQYLKNLGYYQSILEQTQKESR